jgi:DNA-binding MarR family transcriptional regulator
VIETSDDNLGFGDSLALARRGWILEATNRLHQKGFPDYRRSDAFVVRRLRRSSASLGVLGAELSITRQGARKVVDTLVKRGYARIESDQTDARRSQVVLTRRGTNYARAIVEVIARMNAEVRDHVGEQEFENAVRVLGQLRHDFPALTTVTKGSASDTSRQGASQRRSIKSM